jgi:magnesium-transporting ATPase (P-type)
MPTASSAIPSKGTYAALRRSKPQISVSSAVVKAASLRFDESTGGTRDIGGSSLSAKLVTRMSGLTRAEAAARLIQNGPNVLAKDHRAGAFKLLWRAVLNPLVILLAILAGIWFATSDARAGTMMALLITLSVGLKLHQESKASNAAAKFKGMISVTATERREEAREVFS